jgi:hypothetical protein
MLFAARLSRSSAAPRDCLRTGRPDVSFSRQSESSYPIYLYFGKSPRLEENKLSPTISVAAEPARVV